jgi:chromosome segregation ATPase
MSDKDRFEQIKNDYYECDLDCKDIEWLIERVEQLQKEIERLQDIEYELNQKLQAEQWNFLECNRERNEYKQQLQQAEAKASRYENALREIDTHIRSTSEPISYIIQTLKETLPEYK